MLPLFDAGFFAALGKAEVQSATGFEDQVVEESVLVDSSDGVCSVELRIMRKKGTEGQALPCLIHIHGGGYALMTTRDPLFNEWYHNLLCGPGSEKMPCIVCAVE